MDRLDEMNGQAAHQRGVFPQHEVRADAERPQQRQRMRAGAEGEYGGGAAFFQGGVFHGPIVSQRAPLGNGDERKERCICA